MSGKKQKATAPEPPKAMMEPSSVEVPNLTLRTTDGRAEQAVTMLDYEGSPVVTYSVVDKRGKPARGSS
jgi:hypothetical protein